MAAILLYPRRGPRKDMDARVRALGGCAAQAFAAVQAAFGVHQLGAHALLYVQVDPAAVGLDEAHRASLRTQPRHQLPEKLPAQVL